jgi:hypothetical protein
MSKTAIVVFADPKSGGEEALGRVLNAMFLTQELDEKDHEVALIFQGAGTRWPVELGRPDHPGHALYQAIQPRIVGVCGGCADVFGASRALEEGGVTMVRERAVPGTSGIIDLSRYLDQGYRLVTF